MRVSTLLAIAATGWTLGLQAAFAHSLRFGLNDPAVYEFADIAALPPAFGAGEFTVEVWIKPDVSFPVGPTPRSSFAQLRN